MDEAGIIFVDSVFDDLYISDAVQKDRDITDNSGKARVNAINNFFKRIEKYQLLIEERKKLLIKNGISESEMSPELLHGHLLNILYDKFIIKPEDIKSIPNGETVESIIENQKRQLALWVSHLMDSKNNYPTWAKYWALRGIKKIGAPNRKTGGYSTRTRKTTYSFVEFDEELFGKSIDLIIKMVNGEEIDSSLLDKIDRSNSFAKIYTFFLKEKKDNQLEKSNSIDGKWIKYNQGSELEAKKLFESLQGKSTGWCTGTNESTAITQVCGPYGSASQGGDFYVYYTKDENGEYTIPRIAIRCVNHNKIGEIKGVLPGQVIESSLCGALEKQLLDMTFLSKDDVKIELGKIDLIKGLTAIEQKIEKNEELSVDELEKLYSGYDVSFGYDFEVLNRIKKAILSRNHLEDFNRINNRALKLKILTHDLIPRDVTINDDELMKEAIKLNPNLFGNLSWRLIENRDFALECVSYHGDLLKYFWDFKKDLGVVSKAVSQNGMALEYSPHFQTDRKIVLEAVSQNGMALKFAPKYQDDEFIVEAAIRSSNGFALIYASKEIRDNNRDLVMEACVKDYHILEYVETKYKDDKKFALELFDKATVFAIEYLGNTIKDDFEVGLKVVKKNGLLIRELSDRLRADTAIAIEAYKGNPLTLQYILCKDDPEFQAFKKIIDKKRQKNTSRESKSTRFSKYSDSNVRDKKYLKGFFGIIHKKRYVK